MNMCSTCFRWGPWPEWTVNERENTTEFLCPACRLQLWDPFEEGTEEEAAHDLAKVVTLYRESLRKSDFRPQVHTTLSLPDFGGRWFQRYACNLCQDRLPEQPPWLFIYELVGPREDDGRGEYTQMALICETCASILSSAEAAA